MILLENMEDENGVLDEMEIGMYPGHAALSSTKKNELSVCVAHEGGIYYIAASDLEQYMEAAHLIDVEEAVGNIAAANKINIESISVVMDEATEFTIESLEEAGIMMERAAEADSMSLKQAMKWYEKFVRKTRYVSKDETKDVLQEKITILKQCVASMERAKRDAQSGGQGNRIKYALKSLIPFNNIFRFIKKNDKYAGLGALKSAVISGVSILVNKNIMDNRRDTIDKLATGQLVFNYDVLKSIKGGVKDTIDANKKIGVANAIGAAGVVVMRYATYINMLNDQIDRTNEAIEYLEDKMKEM